MQIFPLLISALLGLTTLPSQAAQPLLSGVNDVQFKGADEQRFLGSGFVLAHAGRLYGVTAKHVLLMKKGGQLAHTDIQVQLKHWRLRDPRGAATLEFGTLLNGDPNEALTPKVLERDILIFELRSAGGFTPLRLASQDPKPGDLLYSVGCSYKREATCAQDREEGRYLERKGVNMLLDTGAKNISESFGLSGAPVLNKQGELVGVVSAILPDEAGIQRSAPIDTAYLRELLKRFTSGT